MSIPNWFAALFVWAFLLFGCRATRGRGMCCVRVSQPGSGNTAPRLGMSAPTEAEMPVGELLRRAYYFWRASRGHEEETADALVWDEAVDALLDRLLEERPELRFCHLEQVK